MRPHSHPHLAEGFKYLQNARILTRENREALTAQAAHAKNLAWEFRRLQNAGILTSKNRKNKYRVWEQGYSAGIPVVSRCMVLLGNDFPFPKDRSKILDTTA